MVAAIAGFFLLLMGVSLVVGYFNAMRRHHYVLLVGLTLLCLAAALFVKVPLFRLGLVGLAVLTFLAGFVLAVMETRRTLQDIQREHLARQQELDAYIEQLKRKYQEKIEREQAEQTSEEQE